MEEEEEEGTREECDAPAWCWQDSLMHGRRACAHFVQMKGPAPGAFHSLAGLLFLLLAGWVYTLPPCISPHPWEILVVVTRQTDRRVREAAKENSPAHVHKHTQRERKVSR